MFSTVRPLASLGFRATIPTRHNFISLGRQRQQASRVYGASIRALCKGCNYNEKKCTDLQEKSIVVSQEGSKNFDATRIFGTFNGNFKVDFTVHHPVGSTIALFKIEPGSANSGSS